MRIIVAGGTGLIGRPLSQALVGDGHEVIVLTRTPAKVTNMPVGVKLQQWDGVSAQGWGEQVDGAGAIINLAGEGIADGRWSTARKKSIRESRLTAGKAIMAAINAATSKPKVLIQASAVGYYGVETGDTLVSETASPGNDFLSKVCFDWETSTAAANRLGIRRPILRTGIVLSKAGGAFPKLVLPFKFFAGGALGNGKQWLPWIHIDDEVRAIQFVLANEQADGAFNLAAPNPVTNRDMAKALGEVMGRPAVMPTPGFAMQSIFGEMSTLLLEGQRAIPKKLLELGFQFKYDTVQAALRNLLGSENTGGGSVVATETQPAPTEQVKA